MKKFESNYRSIGKSEILKRGSILLFGLFLIYLPYATNLYYLSVLSLIGIYSILITGLNVAAGFAGLYSLGHAGFFAIGAYTAAILSAKLGFGFWVNLPLSILAAMLAGLLLGIPSLRFKGFYFVIATMALGLIIKKTIGELPDSITGGSEGISRIGDISLPKIGGYVFSKQAYYYLILIAFVLAFIFCKRILNSRFRRQMIALKENEIASETLGIDVYRSKILYFTLSTTFAGLAGCMYTHLFCTVNPDIFDMDLSFLFLLMILVGGANSLWGPYIGVVFLSIFPIFFIGFARIHLLFYGAIFVMFVYLIPDGVAGELTKLSFLKRLFVKDRKLPQAKSFDQEVSFETSIGLQRIDKDIPMLKVQRLFRSFGGVAAIANLDLDVWPGTIHGLIGPNGSGKTTLINLISGLYKCESGQIYLGPERIDLLKPHLIVKKGVGRTFQSPNLFEKLTVLENVCLGHEIRLNYGLFESVYNIKKKCKIEEEIQHRSYNILKFLNIEKLCEKSTTEISPMECRVLEIARALATQPKLLLLDEPASGFTKKEIEGLVDLLRKIKEMGITILLVEHHVRMIMNIADFISVLDFGQNIFNGLPEEVASNEKVIKAYLGEEIRR